MMMVIKLSLKYVKCGLRRSNMRSREIVAIIAMVLLLPIVWPIHLLSSLLYYLGYALMYVHELIHLLEKTTTIPLVRFIYKWGRK
jgi:hypothetical protein